MSEGLTSSFPQKHAVHVANIYNQFFCNTSEVLINNRLFFPYHNLILRESRTLHIHEISEMFELLKHMTDA